eukprot:COSAG04_NODE_13511_length_602_cov_15.825050_3_plen_24_part_01
MWREELPDEDVRDDARVVVIALAA